MKKYKLLIAGCAVVGIGLFLTLPLYFQVSLWLGLGAIAGMAGCVVGLLNAVNKYDEFVEKEKKQLALEAKKDYEKLTENQKEKNLETSQTQDANQSSEKEETKFENQEAESKQLSVEEIELER